ncbi:MAG TPA: PAS domain S-box protein [Burkholderiaceae bacterium]|nr:PAS domain S-box protein [Burkholderiaceae bacterium]
MTSGFSTYLPWVGAVAIIVIVALAVAVWRSLRAREAARRLNDTAQARVARNERELAVLMKSVQELIFRTDASGAITFVNARWAALSGTDARSAIGRHLHDIVETECREAVRALFRADGQGGVRAAQARVRTANGGDLLFDVAVVPLLSDGTVSGFVGSAVDVTERWVAQRQLQAQLAFSAQLMEVNPLPISMTDTRGRVQVVNQAWEAYEGLHRADVVGKHLRDILPEDEADIHAEADRGIVRRGGTTQFETRIRHGDGSHRDMRVIKALVPDARGSAGGILCVQMDISEFREAERATQEARDAADEAARTKSEFVANMSHELRTPLQSIIGFSELGKLRGKHEPRLAAMFEDIHAAGQRMLALVNDLLDVSKIDSTVGTFHLERIDLRGLVRAVVREIKPLLEAKRLDLRLRLSEAPLLAKADPLRFQQVIRNVIANAIKFSPESAVIHVDGQATAAGELHFCVRDQGPGIPESELEHIFDAFAQSSTTKNGSGGTGLGLAICRKIVEAHDGRIYAEAVAGGGAAFHIFIPTRGMGETVWSALETAA